jgi:hypothetical protein
MGGGVFGLVGNDVAVEVEGGKRYALHVIFIKIFANL